MWAKVLSITSAIVVLAGITGGAYFLEDRYANADSIRGLNRAIQTTNSRLDQHFLQERLEFIEGRMDRIEDRCNTKDPLAMPEPERTNYRDFLREKRGILKALKAMK